MSCRESIRVPNSVRQISGGLPKPDYYSAREICPISRDKSGKSDTVTVTREFVERANSNGKFVYNTGQVGGDSEPTYRVGWQPAMGFRVCMANEFHPHSPCLYELPGESAQILESRDFAGAQSCSFPASASGIRTDS